MADKDRGKSDGKDKDKKEKDKKEKDKEKKHKVHTAPPARRLGACARQLCLRCASNVGVDLMPRAG